MIAVICGTPTPETTRVVQMEPGPMPTLTASAPASTSASVALGGGDVAGDDVDGEAAADLLHHVEHGREWPCAVSTTSTSTPGVDEPLGPLERVGPHADGGPDPQPAPLVLAGCGNWCAS